MEKRWNGKGKVFKYDEFNWKIFEKEYINGKIVEIFNGII